MESFKAKLSMLNPSVKFLHTWLGGYFAGACPRFSGGRPFFQALPFFRSGLRVPFLSPPDLPLDMRCLYILSLVYRNMVWLEGFEPPTSASRTPRATKLRHSQMTFTRC